MKTVIHTPTYKQYDKLIENLRLKGISFNSTGNHWNFYKSETCVCIEGCNLTYCELSYFEENKDKYNIISYNDWMKTENPTITNLKIEYTDGTAKKLKHSYETIYRRNDGIDFEKDSIDSESIESLKNKEQEYYRMAREIRGKLNAHAKLFPNK